MPTNSDDPRQAAEAFCAASEDLALASRHFDDPSDSYGVLGQLQMGMIALHQTLTQMATLHEREQHRAATDAGDRAVGAELAANAAGDLERAARFTDRATDELMSGFAQSGQIAWQQAPARQVLAERETSLETPQVALSRRKRPPAAPDR